MSDCLSELTLMLLRAAEGGAAERAHLRGCRACAARYRELERDLDTIADVLRAGPPAREPQAPHLRWRAVGAVAAALLLTVGAARLWRGGPVAPAGDVGSVGEELADGLFTATETADAMEVAEEPAASDEDDELALLFQGP